LINALMSSEQYNAEIFSELIKHPGLLENVREQLRFDEQGIPAGYLTRKLEIAVDENNTTLTLSFAHNDADFAREVINTVLEEFTEFLSERQRERIDLVAGNLERLIALELEGVRASLQGLEAARAGYEPLITYRENSHLTPEYEVLSNDIAHLVSQIAQLEAEQQEIGEFRTSVANMLRKVEDWVVITPAAAVTDVTPGSRSLNVAIAGVLGLMVSVFIAFFMNYWKESAPATVAK
jgi:capsular polysaccharide biosynthesis protein